MLGNSTNALRASSLPLELCISQQQKQKTKANGEKQKTNVNEQVHALARKLGANLHDEVSEQCTHLITPDAMDFTTKVSVVVCEAWLILFERLCNLCSGR